MMLKFMLIMLLAEEETVRGRGEEETRSLPGDSANKNF
jgi:hypothetical protein